jgi:hypothetical protein
MECLYRIPRPFDIEMATRSASVRHFIRWNIIWCESSRLTNPGRRAFNDESHLNENRGFT